MSQLYDHLKSSPSALSLRAALQPFTTTTTKDDESPFSSSHRSSQDEEVAGGGGGCGLIYPNLISELSG